MKYNSDNIKLLCKYRYLFEGEPDICRNEKTTLLSTSVVDPNTIVGHTSASSASSSNSASSPNS